jgi:hypothetical protein
MMCCTVKLESRFNKLKKNILKYGQYELIKSFIKHASIDIKNMDKININKFLITCFKYYKKQKKKFQKS